MAQFVIWKYPLRTSFFSKAFLRINNASTHILNNGTPRACSAANIQAQNDLFSRAGLMFQLSNRIPKKYIDDLHKSVETAGNASSSQVLFLIQSCNALQESENTKASLIDVIWQTILKIGVQVDVSHCNAALRGFVENNHPFCITSFLQDMERMGIQPNRVTYSQLIHKACLNGDLKQASELLETMQKYDMMITKSVFDSMIIGNSRANDLNGCLEMVELMQKRGLEPDGETYAVLAQAYAELGEYEKLQSLFTTIDHQNIRITDEAYFKLIHILAKNNADMIPTILEKVGRHYGYLEFLRLCCIQLIEDGYFETALKLLKFAQEGLREQIKVDFFLTYLIQNCSSVEMVFNLCDRIVEEQINEFTYGQALLIYLQRKENSKALTFMKKMNEKGLELRDHYFFPILVNTEAKDFMKTLKLTVDAGFQGKEKMFWSALLSKFEPLDNPVTAYTQFLDINIDKGRLYDAMMIHLLDHHSLRKAAILARSFPRYCTIEFGRVVKSYMSQSGSASDLVAFLRLYVDSNVRMALDSDSTKVNIDSFEHMVSCLKTLILMTGNNLESHDKYLIPVLQEMIDQHVGIPDSYFDELMECFGPGITPALKNLLQNVVNAPFDPNKKFNKRSEVQQNSLSHLIIAKQFDEAKKYFDENVNPNLLKKELGHVFAKVLTIEQMNEIIDGLSEHKIPLTPHTVLHCAVAYAKEGKFTDASSIIVKHSPHEGNWSRDVYDPSHIDSKYHLYLLTNTLINICLEKGDLNDLKCIQDTLMGRNFHFNSFIESALINYYLIRDDLKSAKETFTNLCQKYNTLVRYKELLKAFARIEDTTSLQELTDIISSHKGSMKSLLLLGIASVHVGKYSAAEKIFKLPGLRYDAGLIEKEVKDLISMGNLEMAEKLVSLASHLLNVDCNVIYGLLLDHYIKTKETRKALDLWTCFQELNAVASNTFLRKLGSFLKNEGIEAPFNIPQNDETPKLQKETRKEQVPTEETLFARHSPQLRGLKMINHFLQKDSVDKAYDVSKDMFSKGLLLKTDTAKRLLKKLSEQEDGFEKSLALVDRCESKTQSLMLASVYFYNNRVTEYFTNLKDLTEKYKVPPHTNFVYKGIKDNPELEHIAQEALETGSEENKKYFATALWNLKFLNHEYDEAEKIYEKYFEDELLYSHCHHDILREEDCDSRMPKLLDILKKNSKDQLPVIFVYQDYVLHLAQIDKCEDALKILEESNIDPRKFSHKQLKQLDRIFLRKNIPFPIDIKETLAARRFEAISK